MRNIWERVCRPPVGLDWGASDNLDPPGVHLLPTPTDLPPGQDIRNRQKQHSTVGCVAFGSMLLPGSQFMHHWNPTQAPAMQVYTVSPPMACIL